ncbi:protein lin-37 homolog [Haliotis asinina]|uniref:protein lin-37 homolog n=1 Tax=Haliotis asinina TaxID=109174 RepID=UPI0035327440
MSRNKHAEVASFRSKLGATLQYLVDKKDESPLSEGEGSSSQPEVQVRPLSPVGSPRKLGARARKRKRKDDEDGGDGDPSHQSYIMKLFDRSVDLAQFEEATPLYPVCRAWMKNQPNNRNLGPRPRTPTPEPDAELQSQDDDPDRFPDIFLLPVPVKQEITDEFKDPRIPGQLMAEEAPLDIHADPDQAPPPEHLLLNHMARWKRIRMRWKEQAFRNELRFNDSLTILKDMFERQCKEG